MRRIGVTAGSLAWMLLAAAALAVKPQAWNFSTEKDFSHGTFNNTVVDSYGQLSLGRELLPVQTAGDAEIVAGFAQSADGAIYVAMGPEPRVYRIEANKGTLVYSAPKGFDEITAIAADARGNLLLALSGKKARLVQVTPGQKGPGVTRFENDDVDYIWAIASDAQGTTYLGTGPQGKVYKLGAAGEESAVVLESTAKNVMSLAFDKGGNLLAGTDGKGLVIRVDSKTNKPFVLLDAGKVDVNAIVCDKDGSIYVATAKGDLEEGGPGSRDLGEPDENPTKSKPGAVEPEPVPPPVEEGKGGARGALPALLADRGILGANEAGIPAELQALLKKAAQNGVKNGPASQKGTPLPTRPSGQAHGHHVPAHSSESPDDEDASSLYRISPQGAVTTLLRQADMNYSLLQTGDDLLIGTGDEGKLYRYRLTDQSLALVARVKEEHVTALLADKTGEVLIGTANMAQVYRMGPGLAKTGTFTSQVLDAGHTADWGRATLENLPPLAPGMKASVATRTGNTRHASGEAGRFWSDWSDEIANSTDGGKISSPVARYLQSRVTLSADDRGVSPVVSSVRIAYQTENLAPRIDSVSIDKSEGGGDMEEAEEITQRSEDAQPPSRTLHLTWEASDPNSDALVYRVLYRAAESAPEVKEEVWTPLAQDLKESTYDWDIRSVPDGKYQVKVIASDRIDNPASDAKETARVSPPLLIDHTPPMLGDLKADAEGNKAHISGKASDALSPVVDVRYQVDGQGDWLPAAAADKLFDSLEEAFTIETVALSTGGHRITVRATDAQGNSSYKAVTISVKP